MKLKPIALGIVIVLGWLSWTFPTLSSPLGNPIADRSVSGTLVSQWDDVVTLEKQSPEYQTGFEDGISAYRSSATSTSETSESSQSEDYQNGYRDGFEYADGFSAGYVAADNGGSSFPEYEASTSYIDGYRQGFASNQDN